MPDHVQDLAYRLEVLRGAHRLKSCYLAGPMTGLTDFNVASFEKGAEALRAAGWSVASPAEHDAELGVNLRGYPTGDLAELRSWADWEFAKSFSWDCQRVCDTDAVIVLPGWEESEGARIEVSIAHLVGKPVFTLLSQRRITKTGCAPEASAPSRTRAGTGEGENRVSPSPTQDSGDPERPQGGIHSVSPPGAEEAEEHASGSPGAPSRHPNSARFHKLVQEIGELHDRKQQDYGSDADPFANVRASTEWGIPAWVGALVRLNDKVTRLKSFARKGSLANESAEDSMRDIAVYALIALVLYEQEEQGEPE